MTRGMLVVWSIIVAAELVVAGCVGSPYGDTSSTSSCVDVSPLVEWPEARLCCDSDGCSIDDGGGYVVDCDGHDCREAAERFGSCK